MGLSRYLDNDFVKMGLSAVAGYAAKKYDIPNKVGDFFKPVSKPVVGFVKSTYNKYMQPKVPVAKKPTPTAPPSYQASTSRHEIVPSGGAAVAAQGGGLIDGIIRAISKILFGR